MFDLNTYLRCAKNHPNEVLARDRQAKVGSACLVCGQPLQPEPERMRGPAPRGRY